MQTHHSKRHKNKEKMKKTIIMLMLLTVVVQSAIGRRVRSVYGIGFYNLENLFDTCHDEGKNDYDFLPTGKYEWNTEKYTCKLRNMARAIADMGTDELPDVGCAIVGCAEVENSRVLDDLTHQPQLAARGYRYIHIEGPDKRGIDCALLYNPQIFSVRDTKLVPYRYEREADKAHPTRGFLTVSGTLAGEHVTVVVCHWPSRGADSFAREAAGRQVKELKDSLLRDDAKCKVIVMGDMNDDPSNRSMTECLMAKPEKKEVMKGEMYNPWYNTLVKEGRGTLYYRGAWNLFDQIVITPNLIDYKDKARLKKLKYVKSDIAKRPYLLNAEGKYQGTPHRTSAGGHWLNGYSDHLPVVLYLAKDTK